MGLLRKFVISHLSGLTTDLCRSFVAFVITNSIIRDSSTFAGMSLTKPGIVLMFFMFYFLWMCKVMYYFHSTNRLIFFRLPDRNVSRPTIVLSFPVLFSILVLFASLKFQK